MFRLLLITVVGIAVLAHSQWGCVACHRHAYASRGCHVHTANVGHAAHGHEGHSHRDPSEPDSPHPQTPCHTHGHCLFVLRLPSGSELDSGLSTVAPLMALTTSAVAIDSPPLVTTDSVADPGAMLSAHRRAQHRVLLL